MSEKVGYWSQNKYYRLNVKDYVEGFCGWKPLKDLIEHLESGRNQSFGSSLFLTGGRITEVLPLKFQNFDVRESEHVIIVRNMKLAKRYKKISETVDLEGKKHWVTRKLLTVRKNFPIMLSEPLTPILLQWLDEVGPKTEEEQAMGDILLFPSPYKPNHALSRSWAYKLIRNLDKDIPNDLREQLGLNKPFWKEGKKISDTIHLWLHWFRSQRASQLVSDYDFEVLDLIDFFTWERTETAVIYARRGWRGLASKMVTAHTHYV